MDKLLKSTNLIEFFFFSVSHLVHPACILYVYVFSVCTRDVGDELQMHMMNEMQNAH